MKRVLVFGAHGQVGKALRALAPATVTLVAIDAGSADVRDSAAVARAIREASPDVVINCAAFTRVDDAESHPEEAMQVNGAAPGVMAAECRARGARFLHISTDYVFDGRGPVPYLPESATAPLSVYGSTKLEGERKVLGEYPAAVVVRSAWVHSGGVGNFVSTAVRILRGGATMRVVDDQIGTPTRALHLADALWRLSDLPDVHGVLHFTDAGVASWYDVANVVLTTLRQAGCAPADAAVSPVGTEAFPRPARRPSCAVLDKRRSWELIGCTPVDWREGVVASTHEILHA